MGSNKDLRHLSWPSWSRPHLFYNKINVYRKTRVLRQDLHISRIKLKPHLTLRITCKAYFLLRRQKNYFQTIVFHMIIFLPHLDFSYIRRCTSTQYESNWLNDVTCRHITRKPQLRIWWQKNQVTSRQCPQKSISGDYITMYMHHELVNWYTKHEFHLEYVNDTLLYVCTDLTAGFLGRIKKFE